MSMSMALSGQTEQDQVANDDGESYGDDDNEDVAEKV